MGIHCCNWLCQKDIRFHIALKQLFFENGNEEADELDQRLIVALTERIKIDAEMIALLETQKA